MREIGFSTGALALGDFRTALRMLKGKNCSAVELSALRQEELAPLVSELDDLDLRNFQYVSFHAPSAIDPAFEADALHLLEQVALRGWPIIVHPDATRPCKERKRRSTRLAFQEIRTLIDHDSPRIVQAWLTGVNPELGDRIPLRLLREAI